MFIFYTSFLKLLKCSKNWRKTLSELLKEHRVLVNAQTQQRNGNHKNGNPKLQNTVTKFFRLSGFNIRLGMAIERLTKLKYRSVEIT